MRHIVLTELYNRMHGPYTSQNPRQLVLPDVSKPLIHCVLNHLINTQQPETKQQLTFQT